MDVMRLEGIGRFVMGLLDQVEILEGDALWDYVQERWKCRPCSPSLCVKLLLIEQNACLCPVEVCFALESFELVYLVGYRRP